MPVVEFFNSENGDVSGPISVLKVLLKSVKVHSYGGARLLDEMPSWFTHIEPIENTEFVVLFQKKNVGARDYKKKEK